MNPFMFISFSLWIQNNCHVKFRYSLLAGLPVFELLLPNDEKLLSSPFIIEWFDSQSERSKNELLNTGISVNTRTFREMVATQKCAAELLSGVSFCWGFVFPFDWKQEADQILTTVAVVRLLLSLLGTEATGWLCFL